MSRYAHPQRWWLLGGVVAFAAIGVAVYFSDLHRAYLFAVIVAFGAYRAIVGMSMRRRTDDGRRRG